MSSAIVALCLFAATAVGAGALVSALYRGLTPGAEEIQARAPLDEPTRLGFVRDAPASPPAPAQAPPEPVQAAPEPPIAAPPIVKVKAPTPARTGRTAKPPKYAVLQPVTPQADWERQRVDYQRARDAYDANERSEGYRWAQQNRIRVQRFCRAAEQRTAAFVEGCMNYVRSSSETKRPDKPAGQPASDQG